MLHHIHHMFLTTANKLFVCLLWDFVPLLFCDGLEASLASLWLSLPSTDSQCDSGLLILFSFKYFCFVCIFQIILLLESPMLPKDNFLFKLPDIFLQNLLHSSVIRMLFILTELPGALAGKHPQNFPFPQPPNRRL